MLGMVVVAIYDKLTGICVNHCYFVPNKRNKGLMLLDEDCFQDMHQRWFTIEEMNKVYLQASTNYLNGEYPYIMEIKKEITTYGWL